MASEVVTSFNLFVDTERNINATSDGNSIMLSLNQTPIKTTVKYKKYIIRQEESHAHQNRRLERMCVYSRICVIGKKLPCLP